MGAAGFGGSFAPTVQYEKWEIHPVFPHFSYFRLCQNLSPNLLAPLCGAALKTLSAETNSKTNWEFVVPSERVIANQRARWCGNLHRIPGSPSSYRLFFLYRFTESACVLSKNGTSIREIATPVCALARNDTEFAKFQFVSVRTTDWQLPVMVSLRDE